MLITLEILLSLLGGFALGWCTSWLWGQYHKAKPSRGLPPPYEPWHKQLLCLKAYNEKKEVTHDLWMCGTQTTFTLCRGCNLVYGETFGSYQKPGYKCKHFGDRGECLFAGRTATLDEVIW